ncbi:hypothetical protein [Bacillus sp. V3-13]|nr:hypothetical protein [Bacillus sp. V3-13]
MCFFIRFSLFTLVLVGPAFRHWHKPYLMGVQEILSLPVNVERIN